RHLFFDEPIEDRRGIGLTRYLHVHLLCRRVCARASIRGRGSLGKEREVTTQEIATTAQGRGSEGVSIPPAGTYELDPTHTVVGFVARHMLSKVRGQFTDVTGAIEVGASPEDSRVEVEVKTGSITTHLEKRDQHLTRGDFLEIEKHPVL